jgi:hypothetical protein
MNRDRNINRLKLRLENKYIGENYQLAKVVLELINDDYFLGKVVELIKTTNNIETLSKQLQKILMHGTGKKFESTPYGDLWGLSRYLLQLKSIYSIH